MRPFTEIDAEIAAVGAELERVALMLTNLREERAVAVRTRDATIVEAFDNGRTIADIAWDLKMKRQAVNVILWRQGRRVHKRTVPISHMPATQQRHYVKCRKAGLNARQARQAAVTVAP